MKTSEIDLCVLSAMREMGQLAEEGGVVEIEARGINYLASDGLAVLAHRAELGKDDPDNTLLGCFILPPAIYPTADAFRFAREPNFATLADDGDGQLRLGGAPFAPRGLSRPWRRIIPPAPSGEAAQLDLPGLSKIVMGAGRAARFDATGPYIFFNGKGPILVTWQAAPNTFGVIAAANIKQSALPVWAARSEPAAAEETLKRQPVQKPDGKRPETGHLARDQEARTQCRPTPKRG